MDKDCFTLETNQDFLIIKPNPIAVCPIVDLSSTQIYDIGELPKGLYFYAITSIGVNGESLPHVFQVYLRHKENSISFQWSPIKYITEYHVYRGQELNRMDGYFTIFTKDGYFHDNGTGVLNIHRFNPPDRINLPIPERIIHKYQIHRLNKLFIAGYPHVTCIYITLKSKEIITLDLYKMVNLIHAEDIPKQAALNTLFNKLENWRCQ